HNGFGANTPITPGMPRFVWSEAARRRGWAEGESGYHVIGAPWTYLLRMQPETPDTPRAGTIFYPFHGFEQQLVDGDHLALARQIALTESGPVTVCLYWLDYQDRRIRRSYERFGFRIVCHGYRGDKNRPGDADFLHRQLRELRRHTRVASNRLSTALLYGASVGCAIGVYGPEMTIQNPPAIYGGNARIRRLWPLLHQEHVPDALATDFAMEELGVNHTLNPAELAEVCGWSELLGGAYQPALAGTRGAT
ncbi:MAG TPA: hypothetical protein VKB69_10400, partial [Micromonosporaceae bacterium]|nr:hypothetical protein [Micromonosporaceae bacterium]